MTKLLMIQGTMSNAGKSLIVAGLCRIFKQDGYMVMPFKSQNMALNSYITKEGLEMGRAQVVQAEAAGVEPSVYMNPILLKPNSDTGSQVIVNGEVIGNMSAREYFAYKMKLIPEIKKAFAKLKEEADIIIIEGAGSPAEINLKENDIVNMGLAEMLDAPVLLVGDIDRGGVFAQLLGTLLLLTESEKKRVKGMLINKFRGDKSILEPGIRELSRRAGLPVCGVVPYLSVDIEDEDSLTERFLKKEKGLVDLAVIRYPRISNFTDFAVFEQLPGVSVRYISRVQDLGEPDMIFLPGSKNTMGDLSWLRESGMEAAVKKRAEHSPVFGICGGYQMLGEEISDPGKVEHGGSMRGMGLLPISTELKEKKTRRQCSGHFPEMPGLLSVLSGKSYSGYEIHMGKSCRIEDHTTERCDSTVEQDSLAASALKKTSFPNIYGSYVHGLFDEGDIARSIIEALAEKKGVSMEAMQDFDYHAFKESQYDLLAKKLRESLDMEYIYSILREI